MLSELQKKIIGLLVGILLIFVCIFRINLFDKSSFTVYLYEGFVLLSIIVFFYFFSRLLKIKLWLTFSLILLLEGSISWKFYQIVEKQNSNVYKLNFWREYYNQHRNIIQFDPNCAVYDSKVQYKLKQGKFTHTVAESSNYYNVNSFGVRDDEKSLDNPSIITIGDSYAMGWGVDQKQTFSEILEQKLNVKVLNTGISSYGTARESILFKQLDRDSCKVLVIQYCENDLIENEKLIGLKKDHFDEKDFGEYNSLVNLNQLYKTYYPFKNIMFLMRYMIQNFGLKSVFISESDADNYFLRDEFSEKHAKGLFEIISKIRKYYQETIIVVHTPAYEPSDKLEKAFKREKQKRKADNIFIIDAAKFLEKKDFYLLDGHLKVKAHEKLANAIMKTIKEQKVL
jgi:hypothetical protein